MRGAWDGIGQRVEGRLSPRPQAVNKHAGHERPLQLRMGRWRSSVHAAVHGRGRRRRRAVHAPQQARVIEIRRRKHPLQRGVVPGLGQQLQAHCSLPLPLGSERNRVRAGGGCGGRSQHRARRSPLSSTLPTQWRPGEPQMRLSCPRVTHTLSGPPRPKISSSNYIFYMETLLGGVSYTSLAAFSGPLPHDLTTSCNFPGGQMRFPSFHPSSFGPPNSPLLFSDQQSLKG